MARSKMTGYGRRVATDPDGSLTWETGELVWRLGAGLGINLSVRLGGTWHMLVHAEDLREAGMFAEGFLAAGDSAALLAPE